MLLRTHFVFNLFVFLLLIKLNAFQFSLVAFAIFFIATCLPDIDTAGSFISRKTKPLSNFIHIIISHREEFHGLLFAFGLSAIVFLIFKNFSLAGIFFLFYFLHLLLDSLTVSGISWFWPFKFKIKGKIKTGNFGDAIIFLIFSLACVFTIVLIIF